MVIIIIIIILNPTVYLVLYHLNVKKCDIKITFKFVICNLNHEIDSFEMERVIINQKQNIDCQGKYNKFVERG